MDKEFKTKSFDLISAKSMLGKTYTGHCTSPEVAMVFFMKTICSFGQDVADALGYVNPNKAMIDHVDDEIS